MPETDEYCFMKSNNNYQSRVQKNQSKFIIDLKSVHPMKRTHGSKINSASKGTNQENTSSYYQSSSAKNFTFNKQENKEAFNSVEYHVDTNK